MLLWAKPSIPCGAAFQRPRESTQRSLAPLWLVDISLPLGLSPESGSAALCLISEVAQVTSLCDRCNLSTLGLYPLPASDGGRAPASLLISTEELHESSGPGCGALLPCSPGENHPVWPHLQHPPFAKASWKSACLVPGRGTPLLRGCSCRSQRQA